MDLSRCVDTFPPSPSYMYTRDAHALSSLSDLLPDWNDSFPASSIAIQKTNPFDSDKSVADTIALMGVHARNASSSGQVKSALANAGCLQTGLTEDDCIDKVFQFVKSNVQFVEDDNQLKQIFKVAKSRELLITPPVLLSMNKPKGDCDDFSMLVCSMLMAKGIQCDFVTVAANKDQPSEFSHVYCMARLRDGRSIPIDASHGTRSGWETERATRKQIWPVFNWNFRRGDGMGTIRKGYTGPPISSPQGHIHALSGLGDFWSDLGVSDSGVMSQDQQLQIDNGWTPAATAIQATTPNVWTSILPNLFGSIEKIAIQTTQQPGVQTTGPNGVSSSTVLPQGATSLANFAIPGTSTLSGSNLLPILLIGAVALFAFSKS